MSAWLETDDVDRLIVKAFQNVDRADPLDLSRFCTPERIAAYRIGERSQRDLRHLGTVCRRMLAGIVEVPRGPRMPMDRVTATMLASLGIDPWAAARIAHEAAGVGIVDGHGDRVALLLPDAMKHTIHDDRHGLTLRSGEVVRITIPPVPESAITAATGGPLAALVSHPVLDALDLAVAGEAGLDPDDGSARGTTLDLTGPATRPLGDEALRAIVTRRSRRRD